MEDQDKGSNVTVLDLHIVKSTKPRHDTVILELTLDDFKAELMDLTSLLTFACVGQVFRSRSRDVGVTVETENQGV